MSNSQPPNNVTKLPDKWDQAMALYGVGASDAEISKALKLTLGQFRDLVKQEPAMKNFHEKGQTLSRAYWESLGRTQLFNKEFNSSLWLSNMKNRFGWADKVEAVTSEDAKSLDQVKADLTAALKQLAKKNPELLRDPAALSADESQGQP